MGHIYICTHVAYICTCIWGIFIHVHMGRIYVHVYMGHIYTCTHGAYIYMYTWVYTCISHMYVETVGGQGSHVAVKY